MICRRPTGSILCAHLQFMDRAGGNCWVGVRRLVVAANVDKGTVAKHRQAATAAGSLIASDYSRPSRSRSVATAIPDELAAESTGNKKIPPSGPALQSSRQETRRLYGPSVATIRPGRIYLLTLLKNFKSAPRKEARSRHGKESDRNWSKQWKPN